jgi:hypothetical protein
MIGDPIWVRMKLGYWTSRDRLTWTRAATVRFPSTFRWLRRHSQQRRPRWQPRHCGSATIARQHIPA